MANDYADLVARHRALKLKKYAVLLVIGELLITAGLILGSYIAYELWISNLAAKQNWSSSTSDLQDDFDSRFKEYIEANPAATEIKLTESPVSGKTFGLLYVPKLWSNEQPVPILEGLSDRELARGIGHYNQTALPGEVGNFAIAGHRATHGEPFAEFQLLKQGDEITVETLAGEYVYELVTDIKVTPQDVWVLDPRPNLPAINALPENSKLITLTTCDPRWSSEKRWIWFGIQKSFTPRAELEKSAM